MVEPDGRPRPSRSSKGSKPLRGAPRRRYTQRALSSAAELSANTSTTATCPDKASTSSTRPARRSASCPSPSEENHRQAEIEEIVAKIARIPPKHRVQRRQGALKTLERDLKNVVFGQDAAIWRRWPRRSRCRAPGLGNPAEADRQLPVLRPHRRRQDRGRASSRLHAGHRADPLRHVRIHGAARGQPPDRRAAGLRRFRPGGLLTEAITKIPCVLLLDEIEKRRIRTSTTSCCR